MLSGPNGAGKSTLLRLISGLVPLTGGEGEVLGRNLCRDRSTFRSELALLGHDTFCYDDLSARENLRFHARTAGRTKASADAVLERVGLDRSAEVTHRLLSAGQKRRLALGVVLAREARLLLLDEPHAGLDAAGRAVLESAIGDALSAGSTVIMASHELERARPLVGREVAMAGGHASGGLADVPDSDLVGV